VSSNSIKTSYGSEMLGWALFEYFIPVLCIVIFWPVAHYLSSLAYPYERTFHTADLIPLASVLILSAVREIEIKHRLGAIQNGCENARNIGLFIVLLFLMVYAILRFSVLSHEIPSSPDKPISEILTAASTFSLIVIIFTGAYCFWLKSLSKPGQ
jgi:hypothetical protein